MSNYFSRIQDWICGSTGSTSTGKKRTVSESSAARPNFKSEDGYILLDNEPHVGIYKPPSPPLVADREIEDGDAYFVQSFPPDPKANRLVMMVNQACFIRQHRGYFAGTWLQQLSDRMESAEGAVYVRALYVYKLREECLVIRGVTTRFLDRRSGGENVVGHWDFSIGDELFEVMEVWVAEQDLLAKADKVVEDET